MGPSLITLLLIATRLSTLNYSSAFLSRSIINIKRSSMSTNKPLIIASSTAKDTIPSDNPLPPTLVPSSNKKQLLNIPNALSLSRIIMIPFFCFFFLNAQKNIALSIYIISCITDYVDGYLARKLNQMTTLGAFLDPVADKLMVCAALILLLCQFPVWWFAAPVVVSTSREILVSALRELMAERGKRAVVKVGFMGKVKTACQMISTCLLIAVSPAADADITSSSSSIILLAGLFLLYVSAALSVISATEYLVAAWPTISSSSEASSSQ